MILQWVSCVSAHFASEALTVPFLAVINKNICPVNSLGRQRYYLTLEQRVGTFIAPYRRI